MPTRLIPSRFIVARTYARLVLGVLISVLFLVLAATPGALAADHTWAGEGGNNDWSTVANWIGGVPDGNDRIIFNNSSQLFLGTNNDLVGLTGMRIRLVNPPGKVTIAGNPIGLATDDPTIDLSAALKDLTIYVAMTQSGNTYYDVAANRTLTLEGDVDGPGIFTKKGDGLLLLELANYTSTTYDITGGTLRLGAADILPATSAVSVGADAVLDLNDNNQTIGSLSGSGQVDLKSGNFTFGDANDTTFGGLIGGDSNSGNVTKQGSGKVTLTGGARGPRFTTGTLSINAGTLQVDSFWISTSVTVASGATLQGSGIIITPLGVVAINSGANLAPGGSTGQLMCESGVTLAAGANFNVELNGTTAATEYDQLIVDESLDLGSANLNLTLGFNPANGDTFTIIDNLSLGAVTGTFNGLAEGATFTSGGTQFQITYAGGDGNDVVLTALVLPLATGTPSSYKVTVTKVEMWNGTSWVPIFSGTAQLDMVAGGTFLGISDLSLPAGTYSQVKVIFRNAFLVAGTLSYPGTPYYTTATTFGGQTNLASTPTTVAGNMAEFTFYNPDPAWGGLNAGVTQTFAITPITVGPTTDYQPTLRFTISNTLLLKGTAGNPSSYFFSLNPPTGSLVEP